MALDILEEKGNPLARQEFAWRDLERAPIDVHLDTIRAWWTGLSRQEAGEKG